MEKIKFLSLGLMMFLLNVQATEFQTAADLQAKFTQEQLIQAFEEQNRLIDEYEPKFARFQGLFYHDIGAYDKALGRYIIRKEKKRMEKLEVAREETILPDLDQ